MEDDIDMPEISGGKTIHCEKIDENAVLSPPENPVINQISALKLKVVAKCSVTKARACELDLPHKQGIKTPIFMPVGTQGTIKGLTTQQLRDLEVPLILGNTYHLSQKPGTEVLDKFGGLHNFMKWDRGILTDSGGFQMVSLLDLSKMSEKGVVFQSPNDGSEMLLTPEKSMEVQNSIGGDIMMALDDVVSSLVRGPRVEEAMYRTLRWMDRCIGAHKRPEKQNLFAIVQGGLDFKLREICVKELVKRNLPGYAIGGLSGGESKDSFWRIVDICTNYLPQEKPRYCMGVGYALDILVCVALGVDMFDCVFPTRTARFGSALIRTKNGGSKQIPLQKTTYANDPSSCNSEYCNHSNSKATSSDESSKISNDSNLNSCGDYYEEKVISEKFSKSYLNKIAARETVGCHLVSINNIAHQVSLMRDIRQAIVDDKFVDFVKNFMTENFGKKVESYPKWAVEAFESVGIKFN